MARNDELCLFVLSQLIVAQNQKGKLPLRGERGFGFVEQNWPWR